MRERETHEVTELLAAHAAGDEAALGELFERVYGELLAVARNQRRRLGAGATLDTVGLVHDCYLKLAGADGLPARDRAHFFALAARAMRHLLVDYARSRRRIKRRGELASVDPDELGLDQQIETVLAVHQALDKLAALDPRFVTLTECRYFAGLSVPETAEAMGVSISTVERTWRAVRAHLGAELAS